MLETSGHVVSLFFKREQAAEQGGLLSGKDPTEYNTHDPIRLWIIQLAVIIITTQLLSMLLSKMRQPKVIAEVLGGIILGPTAFGRIPGFTHHIFPEESRSYLSLTANIGLCLFLFLVGLEIDAAVIKRNARLSAAVALAGMVLPFGLGAALAVPIYKQFVDQSTEFTHFMLFTSVAFSITAFPVLCRILTELKLLDTTVGIVVLSAGVGNDIIGWVLLALSVALVNAGSGLTALYILLTCVGWTLFLLFPVRWSMSRVARMTGSIENGPTLSFLTVTFLVTFVSAFFTDVIGVHAIFGAFLAGLVIPREGGLAIALTERIEDIVSIVFLPLYFTLSGLSTDLGLLDDGITWAYTIAICVLAFIGKFGGCTIAAKYAAGFNWRESSAVGALMSCKGLVELIVLNVGLSAGILSQRVFSMFVLEALLLTFMTTPLVTILYPQTHRVHAATTGSNFNNVADGEPGKGRVHEEEGMRTFSSTFTVVLDKIEHLPAMMAMSQLLRPKTTGDHSLQLRRTTSGTSAASSAGETVYIDALRLMELSDRTSAVMKGSVAEDLLVTDPILNVYKMFGRLNDLEIHPSLKIVPYDELSSVVADHADQTDSGMILVPWLPGTESWSEDTTVRTPHSGHRNNPFDALLRVARPASALHSHFVRGVFLHASVDVAVFVDQMPSESAPQLTGKMHHLFLPFFGGPDDRLALEFVMHLCQKNPDISATIVRYKKSEPENTSGLLLPEPAHVKNSRPDEKNLSSPEMMTFPDTVYGTTTSAVLLVSQTADQILWDRYSALSSKGADGGRPTSSSSNCSGFSSFSSRVEFCEIATPTPLNAINDRIQQLRNRSRVRTLIVAGRSRRMAVENHADELQTILDERGESIGPEVRKTVGDVATACMAFAPRACGLLVLQAANAGSVE